VRPGAAADLDRATHGSSDDPDLLDFSQNVNPRTPDGVERVYREAFEAAHSYPPEPPVAFREAAAVHVDCAPEQVVPTPGGLAAIRLVVGLTVGPGDRVLVPAPGFAEYAREVRLQGGEPVRREPDALLDTDPTNAALAILGTPNNPDGWLPGPAALDAFANRCREVDTPLLADEAFLGYTDRPSLAGRDGVVVARSLTKLFGLPGLRAGFAVATGRLGAALRGARRPWNVGTPALAVGTYCLRQRKFVTRTRERVRTERERLRSALTERVDVAPSQAPFLLVDLGERDVDRVLTSARDRGIALRDARTFRGLASHVRIAVRGPADNDRLLDVLDEVLRDG
jgi:threonine-phosphate decarboxylase